MGQDFVCIIIAKIYLALTVGQTFFHTLDTSGFYECYKIDPKIISNLYPRKQEGTGLVAYSRSK